MDKVKYAITQASMYQKDVRLQMKAAELLDKSGAEVAALKFYDDAWTLGLPIDGRFEFFFRYGSILRKAGRFEESEAILRQAVEEFPSDKAFPVYLALTLHSAGRFDEAMAENLKLMIRLRDQVVDMAKHKPEYQGYVDELEAPYEDASGAAS